MADAFVSQTKREELAARMARLGIAEDDLVEKFILGSGKGGQKVNKTSSCVYLKHEPSGLEVKCQKTRSRDQNRFHARRDICEKMAEQVDGEKSRRQAAAEKIRRQKRRRSRRQKERMLQEKHQQAEKKQYRRKVETEH